MAEIRYPGGEGLRPKSVVTSSLTLLAESKICIIVIVPPMNLDIGEQTGPESHVSQPFSPSPNPSILPTCRISFLDGSLAVGRGAQSALRLWPASAEVLGVNGRKESIWGVAEASC